MGLILSPDIEHALLDIFSIAFKKVQYIATNFTYLNIKLDQQVFFLF